MAEFNALQQSLRDLEVAHQTIKTHYEAEIQRLREELDRVIAFNEAQMREEQAAGVQPSKRLRSDHDGQPITASNPPPPSQPEPKRKPSQGGSGNGGRGTPAPAPPLPPPLHAAGTPSQQASDQARSGNQPYPAPPSGPSPQSQHPSARPAANSSAAAQTNYGQPPQGVPPPANEDAYAGQSGQSLQPVTGYVDMNMMSAGGLAPWRREGPDFVVVSNARSEGARRHGTVLTADIMHSLDNSSVVCCVKFSRDGALLASGCNKAIHVYDVKSGSLMCTLHAEPLVGQAQDGSDPAAVDLYIRSLCFSPDSRSIAAGAEDHVIRVWELFAPSHQRRDESKSSDTGSLSAATTTSHGVSARFSPMLRFILRGHEQDVYSLDWTYDGALLVSGSGDRTVRLWDSATGKLSRLIVNDELGGGSGNGMDEQTPSAAVDAGVTSVAVSPIDSGCIVTGSLDRAVRVWDARTGRLLERFEGHQDSVYSVAISPNGRTVVSGSLDRTLKVWDVHPATIAALQGSLNHPHYQSPPSAIVTKTCRQTFAGHRDFVLSVGYAGLNSPFGAVFGPPGAGEDPSVANGVAAAAADWFSGIEFVVSASKDRTVTFWDAKTGGGVGSEAMAQMALQGHRNSVISVALSPTEPLFATGSGDTRARIWRVFSSRVVGAGPNA
ncbi:WD40-repeat-containing domain protein [Zopfochytrium polystomum]|nr:WD40-repeat-containing domain protein [Zopfochytrium polystomum]